MVNGKTIIPLTSYAFLGVAIKGVPATPWGVLDGIVIGCDWVQLCNAFTDNPSQYQLLDPREISHFIDAQSKSACAAFAFTHNAF